MDRADVVWKIRRACFKANPNLWNDHGDILKRRLRQGVAVETTLGLADVLLAFRAAHLKGAAGNDEDAASLANELTLRLAVSWDLENDDIHKQDDRCIATLRDIIL